MNLADTLTAAGLTPPANLTPGRWLRFPGIGKGRSNRAGWCRLISPTFALYGDFASGLSASWRDDCHRDDAEFRQILEAARVRERAFAAQQLERQARAARIAQQLLEEATEKPHPYLRRKGFDTGLVHGEHLVVPVRDAADGRLLSVQQIDPAGEKQFLPGGRVRGGVYRLGLGRKTLLCEGYATGLSLYAAARRLYAATVIVCFNAGNLEVIAPRFAGALVCADNDPPNPRTGAKAGESAALRTGLEWVMPPDVGEDFNDLHCRAGLHAVVEMLRG